jgi:hypothetical protein
MTGTRCGCSCKSQAQFFWEVGCEESMGLLVHVPSSQFFFMAIDLLFSPTYDLL